MMMMMNHDVCVCDVVMCVCVYVQWNQEIMPGYSGIIGPILE